MSAFTEVAEGVHPRRYRTKAAQLGLARRLVVLTITFGGS